MTKPKNPMPPEGDPETQAMLALLEKTLVGKPIQVEALTLFPLSGSNGRAEPYVLLEDALAAEEVFITEVSEGGSVPELAIDNRGKRPVLILEGDVLVGAKQNRVSNLTVLVAAASKLTLPVSCVERGRWNWQSRNFKISRTAPLNLRRNKIAAMLEQKKQSGRRTSNQMGVWNDVAGSLNCVMADSPTDSLEDAYVSARAQLERNRDQLKLPPKATGFMVALGGRVVGLDLFDSSRTARRCWARLGESYFLSALESPATGEAVTQAQARKFLAETRESLHRSSDTLGLGSELEVESPALTGTGLWYEQRIIHLAAFTRG